MTSRWAQPWFLHVERISYRKKLALLNVFERTVLVRNTRNVSQSLNRYYWRYIFIKLSLSSQKQKCHHPPESIQLRSERNASRSGTTQCDTVEAGVEERRGPNWTSKKITASACVCCTEIILIRFVLLFSPFIFAAVYIFRVWWMSCWCKPLTRLTMHIWSLLKFLAAAVFTKIQLPLLQMN